MDELVKVLAQSGAVGIALAALWLIRDMVMTQKQSMEIMAREHLQSDKILSQALTANTEVLRYLQQTIERKL